MRCRFAFVLVARFVGGLFPFAEDFLPGIFPAFLAGALLTGVFLAGAFRAGVFSAVVFLAGVFLAVGFFAGVFFAGAFLAGAFLAGAFLAGGFFGDAVLAPLGAPLPATACFLGAGAAASIADQSTFLVAARPAGSGRPANR